MRTRLFSILWIVMFFCTVFLVGCGENVDRNEKDVKDLLPVIENEDDKKSASSVAQAETTSNAPIKAVDSPFIQDGLWQGNANQIVLDVDEWHKEVTVIDKSTAKIIDVKGRDVLSIKMNGFSLKTGESKWEDVMYFDVTDENNVGYSTGHEINTGWRPLKDLHSESLERAYKIGAEVVGL